MEAICETCGTQYEGQNNVPERCVICEDERQYVGLGGQRWTTLVDLRRDYATRIDNEEPRLTAFTIEPKFGIGQRAFLIQSGAGNVLWDCISLLDDAAIDYLRKAGGVAAIAISHPHYYTCMVEWSRAFGNIPVYVHKDDKQWVMRSDKRIRFWEGDTCELTGNLQLIRCGGHFDGASVLHWPAGSGGLGALLTGDTIQVAPDRKSVSFMYSYPNYIPLSAASVRRIVRAAQPLAFDRIYGAFPQMTITRDGKRVVERSLERYLKAIAAT